MHRKTTRFSAPLFSPIKGYCRAIWDEDCLGRRRGIAGLAGAMGGSGMVVPDMISVPRT